MTNVKTSVLISIFLFRGKQADAEAPVFPTASAAVFAHSGCLHESLAGSCSTCVMIMIFTLVPLQLSTKLCVSLRYISAEGFLWRLQ